METCNDFFVEDLPSPLAARYTLRWRKGEELFMKIKTKKQLVVSKTSVYLAVSRLTSVDRLHS